MKSTLWLLICNGSVAHVYEAAYKETVFTVTRVQELHHDESRLKTHDLVNDRPGHYNKGAQGRGAYSEKTSPKELELQHFSHELVEFLDQQWKLKSYHGVVIATSPHFESLLKEALVPHEKHLGPLIKAMLTKDYTRATVKELEEIFEPVCQKLM